MGAVLCCEVRDDPHGKPQTPYKEEKQTDNKKPSRKHRKRHLSEDEEGDIEVDSMISIPVKRGRKSIRKSEFNPRDDLSEHMLPPLKTNNPEMLEKDDMNTFPVIARESVSTKSMRAISPRSMANQLAASTKDHESDDESEESSSEEEEEQDMGFVQNSGSITDDDVAAL